VILAEDYLRSMSVSGACVTTAALSW